MTLLPLFLAAILTTVAATPATPSSSAAAAAPSEIFIEAGPGMPTLEDLGLSPAKLYNLTMGLDIAGGIQARDLGDGVGLGGPDYCPPWTEFPQHVGGCHNPDWDLQPLRGAGRNHVQACAQYLHRLGTAICQVDAGNAFLCRAAGLPEPEAWVWGNSKNFGSVASYCEHVACAVYAVGFQCYYPVNGLYLTEGLTVAYGNGDYIVTTEGPQ